MALMGIIRRALRLQDLKALYLQKIQLMATHNIFTEDLKSKIFNLELKK